MTNAQSGTVRVFKSAEQRLRDAIKTSSKLNGSPLVLRLMQAAAARSAADVEAEIKQSITTIAAEALEVRND